MSLEGALCATLNDITEAQTQLGTRHEPQLGTTVTRVRTLNDTKPDKLVAASFRTDMNGLAVSNIHPNNAMKLQFLFTA